jgi:hypothetical protein
MLVRKYDGTMVEINKCDYTNDYQYYKKMGEIMYNIVEEHKEEKGINGYSRQAIDQLLQKFTQNRNQ